MVSPTRKAGGGTRTRGARFTKPVLYQLSYSGVQTEYAVAVLTLSFALASPTPDNRALTCHCRNEPLPSA